MNKMTRQSRFKARLRDPLSDLARKHRTFLLVSSFIGIVMVKTGIVPSKIAAFGIEFGDVDTQALFFVTAATVIYFFAAFLLYSSSDFLIWRLEILKALEDQEEVISIKFARIEKEREDEKEEEMSQEEIELRQTELRQQIALIQDQLTQINKEIARIKHWENASVPTSISRAIFEFIIPIVIAIYAVAVLFTADVS